MLKEKKEPTPFKSAAQKRYKKLRKKNDIYSQPSGHKNLSTGKPFDTKVKRAGTDNLRFEEAEPELPHWDLEKEVSRKLTSEESVNGFRDYLDEVIEPANQHEIDLRVKIIKELTTKGVVESEIRQVPGVTIVESHGDPRKRFYREHPDSKFIFAEVTVRFYPRFPPIGKMSPAEYKMRLLRAVSSIPGVARGIGAHGGVKPLSLVRKVE